ncbi:hypothetical protein LCDVSa140R [Lymphocystis disease virus 3]|uniref:Uncharacterized protein n=1 Tax=Lymphocystis disease virus 3 TaxID=2560566 RepID=A0A1B2RW40_9VIRU|nr:hypothetical protein BZK12_gp140 [Lymphocystis disease virus Sa]AOC55224.1 hypothetical protein LCDVSa140R [Lymphocystis disease virus 3]
MNRSILIVNNVLNTINSVFLAFIVLIWDNYNPKIYVELLLLTIIFTVLTQTIVDASRGHRIKGPVVAFPIACIIYGYIVYLSTTSDYLDLLYNYTDFKPAIVQLSLKDSNDYKKNVQTYVVRYLKTYGAFLITQIFFILKLNRRPSTR